MTGRKKIRDITDLHLHVHDITYVHVHVGVACR